MNHEILEAGIPFKKDWVDLADKVVLSRPPALRDNDQIYMMSGGMILQTLLMHDYIGGKHIIFVGDGDGMSMMFGIFSHHGIIPKPSYMTVLDMDKRTLSHIKRFANAEGFGHIIDVRSYNVFETVPKDLVEQADVFYTNPPYGSKNCGNSGIVFLSRCMELSKKSKSYGIAILPYGSGHPWSITAMYNIQKFVVDHGYSVSEMICGLHKYHLPDNPILASGYVVMDRINYIPHPWTNSVVPSEYLKNFYGDHNNTLPHYIEEDGQLILWENEK
ncbi:MAG: bis-aminopropyl spermidine synthase family protein [Ignavibacteriales bacterium]|nr:bis-aminopropyl spermidine synthase family protein [Ignavibacteriales bacterium]